MATRADLREAAIPATTGIAADQQPFFTRNFGLVWLHEVVNNSAYKTQFENLVADALRRGEKVRFSIEPHFRGIELAPYRIEVWAEGETGTVVTHRSIITIGLSDI